MKFVVSSSELLSSLQSIGKVIGSGSKNILPILDNFLFSLRDNTLSMTASDLETTLLVSLPINTIEREGEAAIPAKLLIDTLKEFPEQPLTFIVDPDTLMAEISWSSGKFNLPCSPAEEYPLMPIIEGDYNILTINSNQLMEGITKTIFATADDELRPTMNGIYFEIKTDTITFVASDAHKLVRYRLLNTSADKDCSFILPKKPATYIKGLLKDDFTIELRFNDKHAIFTSQRFNMSCRLIEGIFPAYNSVIPTNNPKKVIIDRVELMTAVRRVSVFSNQASNLIKLKIIGDGIDISAQDLDFSTSANERVNCKYEGEDIEIGFKSVFLIDILSNLPSTEISIELSDPGRAGLFIPFGEEETEDDLLMLLMPIVIGI
ncbi:MAG: DNA polymerase III subunit beta [Prevotellaceae bacterium]|jgi:DNA polymerase-3 subunit beta|nr:DNA polymerase III subunit beta [Prevotellaceae bacterium]